MQFPLIFCMTILLGTRFTESASMNRTVTNEKYHGLLEAMSIPAELHTDPRDGSKFASSGGALPIHRCTKEQIAEHAVDTHHYCGVFTSRPLAPLAELAYVRVDDHTAEKVFINRNKRLLLTSSDARLAQWRCAPTFESSNRFVAGAPVVSASGELLTVITARRGNHYALANIDGPGGYFDTTAPWKTIPVPSDHLSYGTQSFPSRDALRAFVSSLPPGAASPPGEPIDFTPSLLLANSPRITLTADSGRQIAHYILDGVMVKDVEYL